LTITVVENPHIESDYVEGQILIEKEKEEFATTADKILGLLQDEPVEVELKEGVIVYFYPPSDDEYLEIVKYRADGLQVATRARQFGITPENEQQAMERVPEALEIVNGARDMLDSLNHLLSQLAVDPSFTPDAFRRMPLKFKAQILTALSSSYAGEMSKVRKFRRKPKR
jgi:hypothetical protein